MQGTEALKIVGKYANGKPIVVRREFDERILKLRRQIAREVLRGLAEQWLREAK